MTRIIRELRYAKLRVHKSIDIVILWRESVNRPKSVLEMERTGPGIVKNVLR